VKVDGPARRVERATNSDIESKLARWTRLPSSVLLHGDFASTPSASTVDWLSALRRSGHVVTWSGSPPRSKSRARKDCPGTISLTSYRLMQEPRSASM